MGRKSTQKGNSEPSLVPAFVLTRSDREDWVCDAAKPQWVGLSESQAVQDRVVFRNSHSESWISAPGTPRGIHSIFCRCAFVLPALHWRHLVLITAAVLLIVLASGPAPVWACATFRPCSGRGSVFPAAHRGCGEWVWREESSLLYVPVHLSGYVPFDFQYAALALVEKKKFPKSILKFHPTQAVGPKDYKV